MTAQIHVSNDRLPEAMRRLTDPNWPLCHPERFVAFPIGGGWLTVAILTACCLGCVLLGPTILRESSLASRGEKYSPSDLWIAVIFAATLIAWAIRQLHLIRKGKQSRRELASARYRIGLFFERDFVLVNQEKWAAIIPRQRIVEIACRADDHVESGAQAKGIYIEFLDQTGRRQSQWVPNSSWSDQIRTWHKTGEFVR